MMIAIKVTPYVAAWLPHEYGTDPYHLAPQHKHPIMQEFLGIAAASRMFYTVHATCELHIEIGDSKTLKQHYKKYSHLFEKGFFGLRIFWASLYEQTECERRLTGATYMSILEGFMNRYGICEDDYSLDNLYRQFHRNRANRDQVGRKLETPQARGIIVPPIFFPDTKQKGSTSLQSGERGTQLSLL